MFKQVATTRFFYQYLTKVDHNRPTIVCLHGFTGTSATFEQLKSLKSYNVLVIDLVGHGQTETTDIADYRMENLISHLKVLLSELMISPYYLLGYSMGGRVALAFACTYPKKVKGLIIESSSPGLVTAEERIARQQADDRLAQRLATAPLKDFVDFWENLPLFATQRRLPMAVQQRVRNERLQQDPQKLANSLRYTGTGAQASYWQQLNQLSLPVLSIVGALDEKFVLISEKMGEHIPKMKQINVQEAGHCVHLEQPTTFTQIVAKWVGEQENEDYQN